MPKTIFWIWPSSRAFSSRFPRRGMHESSPSRSMISFSTLSTDSGLCLVRLSRGWARLRLRRATSPSQSALGLKETAGTPDPGLLRDVLVSACSCWMDAFSAVGAECRRPHQAAYGIYPLPVRIRQPDSRSHAVFKALHLLFSLLPALRVAVAGRHVLEALIRHIAPMNESPTAAPTVTATRNWAVRQRPMLACTTPVSACRPDVLFAIASAASVGALAAKNTTYVLHLSLHAGLQVMAQSVASSSHLHSLHAGP